MSVAISTTKTILLAEDDEDDYLLFCEVINDYKGLVKLKWIKNGEELMEALRQESADMIFLDINMPLKNGFECLTEIRGDQRLTQIPIIIFTTSSDNKLVNWMYNAGANLYLCKPTEYKKLKSSIHTVIGMDWEKHTPHSRLEDFVLE
jgi:CheY-like chemotaxis protein